MNSIVISNKLNKYVMYVPYMFLVCTYSIYRTETPLLFIIQYVMIFSRVVQFDGQDLLII